MESTVLEQTNREGRRRYLGPFSDGLNSTYLPLLCEENWTLLMANSETLRKIREQIRDRHREQTGI